MRCATFRTRRRWCSVGSGPLQESLSAQAELLDVKVRFLGQVPREELRGAYSAASVLVHACEVETFGLSVLEAMAQAVMRLLSDTELTQRVRLAARERAQSRFSLARMTEGYERAVLGAWLLASL